jgi:outer membrane protein assembly factor BamB
MHALLLLLNLFAAEDWPQFRGPGGQGASAAKNVPVRWSATENVAWKTEVPGLGWSSPVLADGKLYLTTAVEQKAGQASLRALCLSADTGKAEWDVEVFRKKAGHMHPKNSHASPTPIVSEGRLYVHFGHHGTACLDLKGKRLWANDKLSWAPVHGTGGSPALADGLLVFSRDGASVREVVALDARTGELKWKASRPGKPLKAFSFSTPLILEHSEGEGPKRKVVFSPGSDLAAAYDLKDGKEVWRVTYSGYSVIPRPVFAHGMVFFGTGYDSPAVLAVRAGGKGDVTKSHVAWTLRKNAPHTPSLLVVGDEVYMVSDSGMATCVDARTGEAHWTKRLQGSGFSASPVLADGRIYFLSENGVTTVIKPGKTFEEVARNDLGERSLASLAVTDGALFLRTRERLYRIGKD